MYRCSRHKDDVAQGLVSCPFEDVPQRAPSGIRKELNKLQLRNGRERSIRSECRKAGLLELVNGGIVSLIISDCYKLRHFCLQGQSTLVVVAVETVLYCFSISLCNGLKALKEKVRVLRSEVVPQT